jgi:hypothetical protein
MPQAGYGPSRSPFCVQATRANEIFPAKIRLRKWERQNSMAVGINDKCFNLQALKYFKQQNVYYIQPLARILTKKA